ncbi:MAG TPA: hypothetical protein VNC78_10410 [Actinomycetota bacterium]|nr:hypothetical protein [Actinomycetota bacterium]
MDRRSLWIRMTIAAGALFIALPIPAWGGAAEPAVFLAVEEAQPAVGGTAWYWEPQFSQAVTDPTSGAEVAVVELPNPWCVTTPAGGTEELCKEGRLPIEVNAGDYETPDKIAAVAFDLSLVPIGSEVQEFKVTFKEAPEDELPPSFNHTGQTLQACLVNDFFGDGGARQYKEAPKFACSNSDPTAVREEIAGESGAFGWTFDLTAFAQTWVEETSPVTAILVHPAAPKEPPPPPADTWRVVLAGAQAENGVITNLVYEPSKLDPSGSDTGSTDFGSSSGSDFGSSSGSSFGSSTTTFPSSTSGSDTSVSGSEDPAAPAETGETPQELPDTSAAGALDELPSEQGLPWYVWVAIGMGFIGFSAVKSVVVERATGIRPDGVLAQIRRLNTTAAPPVTDGAPRPGLFTSMATQVKGFGRGLFSGLRFPGRR